MSKPRPKKGPRWSRDARHFRKKERERKKAYLFKHRDNDNPREDRP